MAHDPFQPVPLFAFPLFSGFVAGHEEHKAGLVELITLNRARSPGLRRSNRNGWHSGDDFLQNRDPHLAWVLQNAATYARLALGRYYQEWATAEPRLGRYWANVLDAGGWNAPHHHLPQHWSGVYYVQAGEVGTAPDDLSGRIEFVNPNVTQSAWGSGNSGYSPGDGLMILFPASLLHLVHPHASPTPRITIAWNLDVVAKKQ